MAKLTPMQAREKHARRLKGATEDIRIGVNRVTEAPGEKAAAKVDKMRANLLAAIDSGKWSAGVKRVGLEEWKAKMTEKGIPRIAARLVLRAGFQPTSRPSAVQHHSPYSVRVPGRVGQYRGSAP